MSTNTVWVCDACKESFPPDPLYPTIRPDKLKYQVTVESRSFPSSSNTAHACSAKCLACLLRDLAAGLDRPTPSNTPAHSGSGGPYR